MNLTGTLCVNIIGQCYTQKQMYKRIIGELFDKDTLSGIHNLVHIEYVQKIAVV